jgi:hypothetical protein
MKNMLTDSGYFITILHKNSTPPLPRKASAQGRATWGGGGGGGGNPPPKK